MILFRSVVTIICIYIQILNSFSAQFDDAVEFMNHVRNVKPPIYNDRRLREVPIPPLDGNDNDEDQDEEWFLENYSDSEDTFENNDASTGASGGENLQNSVEQIPHNNINEPLIDEQTHCQENMNNFDPLETKTAMNESLSLDALNCDQNCMSNVNTSGTNMSMNNIMQITAHQIPAEIADDPSVVAISTQEGVDDDSNNEAFVTSAIQSSLIDGSNRNRECSSGVGASATFANDEQTVTPEQNVELVRGEEENALNRDKDNMNNVNTSMINIASNVQMQISDANLRSLIDGMNRNRNGAGALATIAIDLPTEKNVELVRGEEEQLLNRDENNMNNVNTSGSNIAMNYERQISAHDPSVGANRTQEGMNDDSDNGASVTSAIQSSLVDDLNPNRECLNGALETFANDQQTMSTEGNVELVRGGENAYSIDIEVQGNENSHLMSAVSQIKPDPDHFSRVHAVNSSDIDELLDEAEEIICDDDLIMFVGKTGIPKPWSMVSDNLIKRENDSMSGNISFDEKVIRILIHHFLI